MIYSKMNDLNGQHFGGIGLKQDRESGLEVFFRLPPIYRLFLRLQMNLFL